MKLYLRNKIVWILAISIFLLYRAASGYFSKSIEIYTTSKVKNYAEGLIASCISDELFDELDGAKFFNEKYDSNGNISYAYIDSLKINKIRNDIIIYTDEAINLINEHSDFDKIEIPLGYLFGLKYFLADGIRIPISLEVIGNQDVELKMNTITEGINTTIIEVYLDISIDVQVVIPFQNKSTTTNTKIPLAIEVMNNEIPYYLGDIES